MACKDTEKVCNVTSHRQFESMYEHHGEVPHSSLVMVQQHFHYCHHQVDHMIGGPLAPSRFLLQ